MKLALFVLLTFASASVSLGGLVEFFDHAAFVSATGGAPRVVIGFDERPAANNALNGTEYLSQGLRIIQRDAHAIHVVQPAGVISSPSNFASLSRAISSTFDASGEADISRSDNFDFFLSRPGSAAGLWIGNLGGSGSDITVVQFIGRAGDVLASELLNRFHEGVISTGIFDNRIFYGVTSSTTPIERIRVINGANDIDGLVFDDIQFVSAVPEPGTFVMGVGGVAAGLGLGLHRRIRRT